MTATNATFLDPRGRCWNARHRAGTGGTVAVAPGRPHPSCRRAMRRSTSVQAGGRRPACRGRAANPSRRRGRGPGTTGASSAHRHSRRMPWWPVGFVASVRGVRRRDGQGAAVHRRWARRGSPPPPAPSGTGGRASAPCPIPPSRSSPSCAAGRHRCPSAPPHGRRGAAPEWRRGSASRRRRPWAARSHARRSARAARRRRHR